MKRIDKVKEKLRRQKLDSFLISNPINIQYLTGFSGLDNERVGYLAINRTSNVFVVPRMYQTEAAQMDRSQIRVQIVSGRVSLLAEAIEYLDGRAGFEANDLVYSGYRMLTKKLDKVVPTKDMIESLRMTKDEDEITTIKKAIELTDNVFARIVEEIKPGDSELEIAQRIRELAVGNGGAGVAFSPVVAFGANSARPHFTTSDMRIKNSGMLLIDLGVRYGGYSGDLTRVVYIGAPDKKFARIYDNVLRAQKAAIDTVKAGVKAAKVHQAAVGVFRDAGLADMFLHSVGHGIGLEIHEEPCLSDRVETELEEGMVVTVEPGVYMEGWGGVRIEDVVLVTKNGYEVLSKASRDIIRV